MAAPNHNYESWFTKGLSYVAPNIASWWDQKTNAAKYDSQLQQEAYEQNLALQQQQQDYEAYMSNTQYQRQVEDMKAAGLNVGAIGGGGGGASAAGGTGLSTQTPSQTRNAQNGNEQAGIEQATNALTTQAIVDLAMHHKEELIKYIENYQYKVINTARKEIYNYG